MHADETVRCLKQAKSRPMHFVFFHRGAKGKLIVSKKKISAAEAKDAKIEIGGRPLTGTCYGPLSNLVFEVDKAPPGNLANVLRRVVKEDAGLSIRPAFKRAGGDANEDSGSDAG